MKKALVLCGGEPQIALIKYLKSKDITVILADMNENVAGRAYADIFYPVSVLDVAKVEEVAIAEKVDFVVTVCADQVLEVVAKIAEKLGLPWYINAQTAENVSKKSYMKEIFTRNNVPTSKYVILQEYEEKALQGLKFPLIVKPVDAYSSRGVCKVTDYAQLRTAFMNALQISRSKGVIIEEFVVGDELTVDVYVENGKAHVLSIMRLDKIGEDGKFVIHRSRYPADINAEIERKIEEAAQSIADAFELKNSPMLIQLITDGENISVVEFCARTGGGVKFRLIKRVSGFDVVQAVADFCLGIIPHYENKGRLKRYITNEFLYCRTGEFDKITGLEELHREGIINAYYIIKKHGHVFEDIRSSGDRVAYYTIEADTLSEMQSKRLQANAKIKALSTNGEDLLRHDLIIKNL